MALSRDALPQREAATILPTPHGDFRLFGYQGAEGCEHLALVCGDLRGEAPVLARIHSECLTGDVFRSRRCDCGEQLDRAMALVGERGRGVVIYLRQEGRGIGLLNKVRAYALQDSGHDTVEANAALGFCDDLRDYAVAAEILRDLGVAQVALLTNNPRKIQGLVEGGVWVAERIPLVVRPNARNRDYLRTKSRKMGHFLPG